MLDKVKHVILVLSGKGGVGKSTVSVQLSLALKESGFKVGLLDIDLCGPSIPHLLGLEGRDIYQCENGWLPIYSNEMENNPLSVMSIGFLLKNKNEAVIWRGPKKTAMIRQFLNDVEWGELDYLIVDTPPGTSDEHITIMECMQNVRCDGALIVTTPQQAALDDVRKEITFCRKTNIPILGIIENMSGFVCPHCSNCTNIFSSDGGKALADMAKVNLLGILPIDPRIGVLKGSNSSVLKELPESSTAKALKQIVSKLNGSLI